MPVPLLIIIIVLILTAAFFYIASYSAYRKAFYVRGKEATGFYEHFFSRFPELKSKTFSFPSGGDSLFGVCVSYEGTQKGLIVIVHGWAWNLELYLPQAEYFAKAGYSVFLFDGTGIGRSGGSRILGLPQHLIDTGAALDFVESAPEFSGMPVFLYGHSWGGYAADAVSCLKNYSIKGILSVSAYYEALGAMKMTARKRYGFLSNAFVLPATVVQRLAYGRAAGYTAVQGLILADCPVMVVHSKNDFTLSFEENYMKIKKGLIGKLNVQFWEAEGENHNLGAPWNIVKRRRLLQGQIDKAGNIERGMLEELWELQLALDEEVLERFKSFLDSTLELPI